MPLKPWGDSATFSVVLFLHVFIFIRSSANSSGFLSSSLYTFQEASCDGEPMKMSCPQGMLVSIQFAQYGRQVPSSEMCPGPRHSALMQSDSSGRSLAELLRLKGIEEDTNCLATTSQKVILDQCQDKQKCYLVASTRTFQQDPCPGTRKYLEVAYKCRPEQFTSETVCEGDQLELRCDKTTRIAISSGLFGRSPQGDNKCPELLRNTSAIQTSCQSRRALHEILQLCQGRKSCTLEAEEYIFGNPCPLGVNKYLNVVYTCVPKKVLKPLRRHNHRKHKKTKPSSSDGTSNASNSSQNIPPSSTSDSSSSNNNKIQPHTTRAPEYFPADAAHKPKKLLPGEPAQQHPSDPSIGESKDQNSKEQGNNKNGSQSGKDVYNIVETTACTNYSGKNYKGPSAVGLLTDWLNAFNFIKRNKEKAILYLVLGVTFGIICLLFVVIIRLAIVNKRKSRAKLDISEPVHENTPPPANHIEAPTLERSDSMDRIEVVRFNPLRSRDFATCTLRSDIGNRSLQNYYG